MGLFRRSGDTPALDSDTADRLLRGQVPAADAPPGYESVVELLQSAAGPTTDDELVGADAALTQFRREFVPSSPGQGRRLARPALAASVACAVLVVGALSAAAAGVLPGPAQRLAHTALARVGIEVAAPSTNHASHRQLSAPASTSTTVACTGTCPSPDSTTCLPAGAACPDNHGAQVCTVASDGRCMDNHGDQVCIVASAGRCVDNHGAEVCSVASNGACRAASTGGPPSSAPTAPTTTRPPTSQGTPQGPPSKAPKSGTGNNGHPPQTHVPPTTNTHAQSQSTKGGQP